MSGVTFTRENLFKGWAEGENSRVVYAKRDIERIDMHIKELRKCIANYHTEEAQDPYFYSVRTIYPADRIVGPILRNKKKLLLFLTGFACACISLIVFCKTCSYFENAWKICQEIALKREYVISGRFQWYQRYATAQDIWDLHPAGAPNLLFLRNAICLLFPFAGLLGGPILP